MTVVFHPEAEEEFTEAINYYEACKTGLGMDFPREVAMTVQNIANYPDTWPEVDTEICRCLVHRFPYGVLYHAGSGIIGILAVMSLHRDPD